MDRRSSVLAACAALAALGGCARKEEPADLSGKVDPAIAAALADPLMTDPDLASRNLEGAGLVGEAIPVAAIPLDPASDESRESAKAEAEALLGGTMPPVPQPTGKVQVAAQTAMLSWQARFARPQCAEKVRWTFAWAAKMPTAFPVYPRGHVQEAVGSDGADCPLRAINFRTPVSPADIMVFYHASARKAGFTPVHGAQADTHSLVGTKGAAGFAVLARPGEDGMTEVDLLTQGS